jgi:two-component system LytT family response regulator
MKDEVPPAFIFVKEDKVTYRVNCNDILFIESVGDYNKIVTAQKVYLTYQTLRKLQEILPANSFPRIHKSYIVSLSKIDNIIGNQLKIKDILLPVGQTYRESFFKLLEKLK